MLFVLAFWWPGRRANDMDSFRKMKQVWSTLRKIISANGGRLACIWFCYLLCDNRLSKRARRIEGSFYRHYSIRWDVTASACSQQRDDAARL
jgi:hypothetical protein